MAYRLFFAIWPNPAQRTAICAIRRQWQHLPGRPVRPENLHMTLLFLGKVESSRKVEQIIAATRQISATAFDLQLQHVQPSPGRHNMLWLTPDPAPTPLRQLHEQLHQAMLGLALAPDGRGFRPHVTVFRQLRQRGARGTLPKQPHCALPAWPVTEFVLINSHLEAQGSRYDILERFALKQSDPNQ